MKKSIFCLMFLTVLTCADTSKSHTETAKAVVESFYNNDNDNLKANTTPESYEMFLNIQAMMTSENPGPI